MYHPFPYQTECLAAVEDVLMRGLRRALVVMASGLGKTVTMAFVAKMLRKRKEGRVLFLCHSNDLLYQAKTTFEAVNGSDHRYGYYHGEQKALHHTDFLFASFQTMETSRELFSPSEFAYIIVDESHHSQADTFRATLDYFKADFLLGATATPERLDMRDIRELFGQEIYSLPLEEAMARGLLTPIDYRLLTDEIVRSELLEMAGDRKVSLAELNRTIFIPQRDEEIARIITKHCAELGDPRTMIFCNSIKHCEHLTRFVPESFAIHSRIPDRERAVRLEMFRQGIIKTVLTVNAFNEGIDIPEANLVVFLRSTTSKTIFLQQLGRGLRRSDGKDKVVALDFVANCERIKMVRDLYRRIEDAASEYAPEREAAGGGEPPMTLNVHSVEFMEKIVPIFHLLDRVRPNFYPTWQEASEAVILLGIKSTGEYRRGGYRADPRLPSHPSSFYQDFPNWPTFLLSGNRAHIRDPYQTWQEASAATLQLKINGRNEYQKRYREDEKLPSAPAGFYTDFPGWSVFFGKEARVTVRRKKTYRTWSQAAIAAKRIGIKSIAAYHKRHTEDHRLPKNPRMCKDFPGWPKFFGKQ